jgi:uncharacterized membrane protein YcaP (DUF421 family)
MQKLLEIDWTAMFVPSIGLLEMVVRGSIMYLALFVALRFLGNRQSGQLAPADLLVIVLIADASQNALGADYRSLPEGIVLVLTIIGWDYVLDWLQARVPALRPLLEPPPLLLVDNGKVLRRNLRREMITPEQLEQQLREQGVEHVADVKRAYLEGDGHISVIKRNS